MKSHTKIFLLTTGICDDEGFEIRKSFISYFQQNE